MVELSQLSDEELQALLDKNKTPVESQRARTAAQGATFGFSDEIEAALRAPFSDRNYSDIRNEIRGGIDAYRQDSPWEAAGYELGGGLLTGGLGATRAAASMAARGVGRLGQLAAVGAGQGAIAGAGYANEVSDIPLQSTIGATIGAPMGAAGRVLERVGAQTASNKAGRQIQQALKREGQTVDSARQELERLGPQGMLADISPSMQAKARSVALQPGPGQAVGQNALNVRQSGMTQRIKDEVGDVDYLGYLDDINIRRRTEAKPFYDKVKNTVMDGETPRMNQIRNSNAGKPAWKKAIEDYADDYGFSVDDVKEPEYIPEVWDLFGRRLRGQQGVAVRSGDNTVAGRLGSLIDDVNDDLYSKVPALKDARKIAAGPIQAQKAAAEGRKLFTGKPDVTARQVSKMAGDERDAFVQGAMRALFDKLESSVEGANAARNLIKSEAVRSRLKSAFKSNDDYDSFISMLEKETQMGETFSNIMRGSRTSAVDAEKVDINTPLGIFSDIMSGNFGQATRGTMRAATQPRNLSEKQSGLLGTALFSQGDDATAALLNAQNMAQPAQYVVPGLLGAGAVGIQR